MNLGHSLPTWLDCHLPQIFRSFFPLHFSFFYNNRILCIYLCWIAPVYDRSCISSPFLWTQIGCDFDGGLSSLSTNCTQLVSFACTNAIGWSVSIHVVFLVCFFTLGKLIRLTTLVIIEDRVWDWGILLANRKERRRDTSWRVNNSSLSSSPASKHPSEVTDIVIRRDFSLFHFS